MSHTDPTVTRSSPRHNCKQDGFPVKPRATVPSTRALEVPFSFDVLDRLEAIFQAVQLGPQTDQALRLPDVLAIVGVSKSTWYARLNPRSGSHDPRAPHPFKLGPSLHSPSVWWRSAVMAYVQACAAPQAIAVGNAA